MAGHPNQDVRPRVLVRGTRNVMTQTKTLFNGKGLAGTNGMLLASMVLVLLVPLVMVPVMVTFAVERKFQVAPELVE